MTIFFPSPPSQPVSPTSNSASSAAPCQQCSDHPQPPPEPDHQQQNRPSSSVHTPLSSPPPTPPASPTAAAPPQGHPMITRAKSSILKPHHHVDLSYVLSSPIHHALFAAKDPKDPKWFSAMCDEMRALKLNSTWDLVPRPSHTNIVGSKWVFRTEFHVDGSVDMFKARLVAQGITQVPGLGYSATFSPVVKASTVRIILSLAVLNKWPMHQLDVKNAFLHVYVDHIILTGNNPSVIRTFINHLNKEFLITDLGKLNHFLGLEVSYHDTGLFLSQSKYAHDILSRAHMLDAKLVSTTLSTTDYFTSQGTPFSNVTLYRSLVGALQYLTITRPDLSYAVNQVSQFLHAPMVIWITHLLRELYVLPSGRPTIMCDNRSAIFLSQNPVAHKRATHIDIDYHFIRELVLSGKLHTK
uniref:Reverse transcriptase Ty1/copia-type domain-containing protein n=1 Tax=Lactuca sativa TaxID=4236 RepID=A0A9R1WY01_LACSA|nr:hypothetical protein LSAT_V11C800452870 [Lactuca sativa]